MYYKYEKEWKLSIFTKGRECHMSYIDQVSKSLETITSKEQMLGKGLNIPNNATCSGSRKIMNGTHQSHTLVLSHSELPYIGSGYENRFGEKSSSIIEAEGNLEVIAKIPKFKYAPDHHYYLIVRNIDTDQIDVIERVSYKYKTEVYGYLHNNSVMDSYQPGSVIPKGTILRRSIGFDQFGNKTNGRNINVAYMALDHNMEDSVVISERCAEMFAAPLIRSVKIIINENDIPLNIYGNDDVYKVFPDIGEDIKNGILMAYRREIRQESIYTQSVRHLQEIMMSDEKITLKGRVIDINIYCNNPENIKHNAYNSQLNMYYTDRNRMNSEIISAIGPYITQGNLSYAAKKMFTICKDELNCKKFIDKKMFSNIIIEFFILEERNLAIGDKVADRYGGKGVISTILPTENMPKMINGDPIDMIKNASTMYNRENAGQIFEIEVNYISMCILDRIRNNRSNYTPDDALQEILKFLYIQSPKEAEYMERYTDTLDNQSLIAFLESILAKKCIMVSNDPISDTMTIDKLGELYNAFPWIDKAYISVPIRDSNGNLRFVPTKRRIIAAPQYCIRLKQFAEEKFSATSLSSTNLKNENAKSKAYKNYREANSNTPIKFGQMESGDLAHMGTEYVVINLLLHSLSPRGRRLVEQIATGDPYNVDVKLDTKSKNRSVEILNARLKTMGYRIVFKKHKKHVRYAILSPAVEFVGSRNPLNMEPAVEFQEDGYNFDEYYRNVSEIKEIKDKLAVTIDPISFVEDDEIEL